MTERLISKEFDDVWQALCKDLLEFYINELTYSTDLSNDRIREIIGSLKAVGRLKDAPKDFEKTYQFGTLKE